MPNALQHDYGDTLHPVYFELGEHAGIARSVLEGFLLKRGADAGLGAAPQGSLQQIGHGYEVRLPTQLIPEVVRELVAHNVAVYQVIRRDGH